MSNRTSANPRISGSADSTTTARHLGATSLIKYEVYSPAGKCLGKIEEIVLDARTGCVRYAVLAIGGFLGIGQKRVAVPWSVLTPDAESQRCIVDVPQMKFVSVPVFPEDPWLQRSALAGSKDNAYLLR